MFSLRKAIFAGVCLCGAAVAVIWAGAAQPARSRSANNEGSNPHRAAILKSAQGFLRAFNAHDAGKAASYFSADAVLVELDGEVSRGRKSIEAGFTESFKASPEGKISLAVDSIRIVSPTVAIEEGRLTSFPDGRTPATRSRYEVVHVRGRDGWKMVHARTLEETTLSHNERLKDLEWMIGSWVDEAEDSVVETTCQWSADKNFLLRKFTLHIEGERALSGVQRIGWDPLTKQFKSWVFDSGGGYATGLWSRDGSSWVVKLRGVRTDGTVVTATNRFTPLSKDRIRWTSTDRMAGNERMDNATIIVVRKAPQPKVR